MYHNALAATSMPPEKQFRGFVHFSAPFGTKSASPIPVLMSQKPLRQSQYSFYTVRVSKDMIHPLHPVQHLSMPLLGLPSSKSPNLTHTNPNAHPQPLPMLLLGLTDTAQPFLFPLPLLGQKDVSQVATATLRPLPMPLPGLNDAAQPYYLFPLPLPGLSDTAQPNYNDTTPTEDRVATSTPHYDTNTTEDRITTATLHNDTRPTEDCVTIVTPHYFAPM
jgi:hypothetical protein